MAGEKCQVCGGRVVNGRCSLCGMPYRNDDILYHLNEPREVHYKHASAKVRDLMRGYGSPDGKTEGSAGGQKRSPAGSASNRQNAGNAVRGAGAATGRGGIQGQKKQPAAKNTATKQAENLNQGRNRNQGTPQTAQKERSGRSGGKGWIIWLIIGLLFAIPGLMDTIIDWIGTNL